MANNQQSSPAEIEREIEQARVALATSLDQLAERTSPKRIAVTTKNNLIARAKSPQGQKVIGAAVAGVVALVVIAGLRKRSHSDD